MRSFHRAFTRSLQVTLARSKREKAGGLHSRAPLLGPLESRLLELLWTTRCALTVRRIQVAFPELAYTTLMTTLDRLYRKGLLLRHKEGRAFVYEPRAGRDELLSERLSGQLTEVLMGSSKSTLILSTLVRAVGRKDATLLDELDALVKAERRRLKVDDP